MAEVIDLKGRKSKERRIAEGRDRRRAQAVASALSCGLCPRRCAHCGQAVEFPVTPPAEMPYPFCEVCQEEYQAFRRLEKGGKPEAFWHTPQWAGTWRNWLAYMQANQEFRGSPAFLKLMEEHLD